MQAARRKRGREDDGAEEGYAWEGDIERPWEEIEEDERGHLKAGRAPWHRRRRDEAEVSRGVRRGVIRYLAIVFDLSAGSLCKDFPPSRHAVMMDTIYEFVLAFFDQNPLSQIGLLVTRDETSEQCHAFTGDGKALQAVLEDLFLTQGSGCPSLENALRRAMPMFEDVPGYASREVLILFNSLHTIDPGDVFLAVGECANRRIQVSAVNPMAEMYVLRKMARETHGTSGVADGEPQYRELVMAHLVPPPCPPTSSAEDAAALIPMGFPQRRRGPRTFCVCHSAERRLTTEGYFCPRCQSKVCSLPAICHVCALTLVAAPHLARSYHHLFPLDTFELVEAATGPCAACQSPLEGTGLQCPTCRSVFCDECDHFIHKSLHNCPRCLT